MINTYDCIYIFIFIYIIINIVRMSHNNTLTYKYIYGFALGSVKNNENKPDQIYFYTQ